VGSKTLQLTYFLMMAWLTAHSLNSSAAHITSISCVRWLGRNALELRSMPAIMTTKPECTCRRLELLVTRDLAAHFTSPLLVVVVAVAEIELISLVMRI
jgi:hypothetical protein